MYTVNVEAEDVYLKDITSEGLGFVLKWYNKDEFKYATGIEGPVSMAQLTVLYNKIEQSRDHFFAGIYKTYTGEMIGFVKGQLKFDKDTSVWINTVIIDQAFQGLGYGTKSVNLLIDYTKMKNRVSKVYLAVAECNVRGHKFWSKLGFKQYGRIDKCIKFKGVTQNALILHKMA